MTPAKSRRPLPPLFAYPRQAQFGRILPKAKLYEHGRANARLKELFVKQVEQIVWQYKLAPETINLPATPAVPEIQVFSIKLKKPDLHYDVLRCIDDAVRFPLIFELMCGDGSDARARVIAAYKQPRDLDCNRWMQSDYFASEWISLAEPRAPPPRAIDLSGLYTQLLLPLFPISIRDQEAISDVVARSEMAMNKRKEIERTSVAISKEKQFNKKTQLNTALHQLLKEYERICK